MSVSLVRQAGLGARVPVTSNPFWIGRDRGCQLVVSDPRIARRHARLRYQRGEYMLSAAEGADVWVNGDRVPLMSLRSGDLIELVAPGPDTPTRLRFENRMEDAFVPPDGSFAEAWSNHPGSREPSFGPGQFGGGAAFGQRPLAKLRRAAATPRGDLVVKALGPVRDPAHGDRYQALLTALAGQPHPALAEVIDGGLAFVDDVYTRWMATRYVAGAPARTYLAGTADGSTPMPHTGVLDVLRSVAAGLAELHRRGYVHRDVSPGNVIVTPGGAGVLIDFDHAVAWEVGVPASLGVIGTPGYLAPEEVTEGGSQVTPAVDVYGLGAVGYALLVGQPPATGADVLEMLSNALSAPPRLSDLGFDVPDALESAVLAALEPDPVARPDIVSFERALAFAEVQLGL